jgi:hypothetical protein
MVSPYIVVDMNMMRLYHQHVFPVDIDECSEGTDGCDQLCSNSIGSYECVCNVGYRLASDGFTCNGMHISHSIFFLTSMEYNFNVDINECMEGSDRCIHNCQNTEGSYTCICNEGFLLDNDGYSCIGKYVVLMPQHLLKLIYIVCICTIINVLCAEINECQDGNSSCEQVCMNTIGSYECACYDGYRLNQDRLTCTGSHFSVNSYQCS